MNRMWYLIETIIKRSTLLHRKRVQQHRLDFFSNLAPRRIWLYLRLRRLDSEQTNVTLERALTILMSDENSGPEDVIVDGGSSPSAAVFDPVSTDKSV
jgi:hypothetical protein